MQPFLVHVAKDLKERFGKNISKTALIFNNKRPTIFLKKYLSAAYEKTFLAPEFFTVQEFMALSTEKAVANEISRFFILYECYNQLREEQNKPSEDPEVFYALSQTLLSDFDEIDYALADPISIYTYLEDLGKLKQTFSDFTPEQQQFIAGFWSSFSVERQAAVQQKFIELWQSLPKLYTRFKKRLQEEELVSISGVYRDLAEGNADRPGFIDDFEKIIFIGFNALNKCEAVLFKKWQTEGKALFYFDADPYYLEDPFQEAGLFLRKNLKEYGLKNALGEFPSLLNTENKELSIYPVSGFTAQAKALHEIFPAAPEGAAHAPDKAAVILADEALLTPVLQSISDDHIINITMGYSMKQSAVYQLVSQWIRIQKELGKNPSQTLTEETLHHFLSLSLLAITEEEKEIILGRFQKENSKAFHSFLLEFRPLFQLFFIRRDSGTACLEGLKDLLLQILHQKEEQKTCSKIEGNLLLRAYQELNKLQNRLANYSHLSDVSLTLNLIHKSFSRLTTPLEGEPLEGVQIMGMLESRSLDFDEVFILGANDGILPYNGISKSFIPETLRKAHGLPLQEDKESLSAYLFYRLFQRAKKVHVLYNDLIDHRATGEVTRFVSQLAFESHISVRYHPPKPLSQGVSVGANALVIEKTESVMKKLEGYFVPGQRTFSASALKTYLDCPLRFFMKYVAEIREPKTSPEPYDYDIIGTVFHHSMQEFYGLFGPHRLITKEEIKKKKGEVTRIVRKALKQEIKRQSYLDGHPDSREEIAFEIILAFVRQVLQYDMENEPFEILGLEKEFTPRIKLNILGKERAISFKGFFDRIDKVNGKVRIIDYKTGGDSPILSSDLGLLFSHDTKKNNHAAFQTLLYALLYKEEHGVIPETHIYGLRTMGENGTALILKIPRREASALNIEETLPIFKEGLESLLGEIFNPEIPFRHNETSAFCENSPYAIFCHPQEEEEPDQNP